MAFTKGTAVVTSGIRTTTYGLVIHSGTIAGDLLVLINTNRDATTDPTVTDDDTGGNTWTKIANQNANTNGALTIWAKYATSGTASKTVTSASNTGSCSGVVMGYRGALVASPITGAFGTPVGESNAGADESQAGITTGAAGSMVIHAIGVTSNDTLAPGNRTATDPATITEDGEGISTGGSDCSASLASTERTAAGATGTISWAMTDGTGASIAVELFVAAVTNANGYYDSSGGWW